MTLMTGSLCRPGLLLPVIKYLVFFNTFVFANSIFFATQFGRRSCFFSRTGFQGWVPISWWVSDCLLSPPLIYHFLLKTYMPSLTRNRRPCILQLGTLVPSSRELPCR